MKNLITICMVLLGNMLISSAQPNNCYKKVDHAIWIVDDLRSVIDAWQSLGFSSIKYLDKAEIRTTHKYIETEAAAANLGGSKVIWVQPVRGRSFLTDYLEKRGPGIIAIIHPTESKGDLKEETERLQKRRVKIEYQITIKTADYNMNYTIMHTQEDGKYNIGYIHENESQKLFSGMNGTNRYGLEFSQYAFTTEKPKDVSRYWSRIGLPKLTVTHNEVHDKKYYDEPADFDMKLGWQRHGDVVYEWCIPLKSPNVYEDHIKKYGEGVHHFGFNVADLEQTVNHFIEKGFVISQSGGWGTPGKPGSGRFAYLDPATLGGVAVELLWNF